MSLLKENVYLDDWKDLKEYTEELEKEEAEKKDQHNVTKDFVGELIEDYKEYDEAKEQAEYDKIYQKIADISAGGGTDLSDYLKKAEAEETYATKSEIPSVDDFVTQQQLQEAVSDKATLSQVATLELKVDQIDLTPYAKIEDVSAEYAKKSEISSLATEQYVQEQIAELVDGAPEELNSFKELSDALKDQGDVVSAINATLATKADASTVYTKEQADAKFLTEHLDLTDYAKKTDIPSVENLATKAEVEAVDEKVDDIDLTPYATIEYVNNEITRVEEEIPDTSAFITADALEPYAKKTDIPDTSNLATKSELAAVEEKIPSIEGLVDEATLAAAVDDKATIAQVSAVDLKVDTKIDASLVYTKTEADDKFLTEHQDLSDYAKKSDIPDTSNLATKDELAAVDAKVDAIDLTPYATKNDVSIFATKTELDEKADAAEVTAALSEKATIAQVAAVEAEIPDVSNLASKDEVATADTSVLQNILGRIWTKKTANPSDGHFYSKLNNANGSYSLIFNESDGGGSQFKDSKTISYVGVNDGGDNTSTGIFVQIYSKDVSSNIGTRMNVNPSGIYYGVGSSTPMDEAHEVAVKGDVDAAVENIESALDEKANTNDVVSKEEYDQLKAQFDYLEQLVMEYAEGAQQEKINDGKIDDLSPDNKAVNITEPMQSVQLPEATVAYTVDVPLKENATVSLTSNKYAYINNTSDEPVDVAFGREVPETESETVANPVIYITGQYDTITVSNVKISQKDPEVNSINNVIITEDNEKTVEITASLADGATITNNSACPVTINNKAVTPEDADPNSVIVVAPNSTVTVSGGNYGTFESTVGDDTLYINKSVSIDTLVVKKGNVIVNDYEIESHIKHIQNDTKYTVTPKIIEVYNQSDWSKSSSTPALYEVMNDLTVTNRIAPGIFGSSARIKLNGHTVTCSDENAAFLLRGSSHYIIENGTIRATGYGIWLAGGGTVELKDVHVIADDAHSLYIEKANGKFITSGNCRFEVTTEDKKYTLNYKDDVWTNGYRDGFLLGEGTEVVGQDVAASMSEPGGPVNMLPAGYHTESFEEDGKTIYRVVKDSE